MTNCGYSSSHYSRRRNRGERRIQDGFRFPNRATLNGILFVLKTGIRWNHLPTQFGFGSGATYWRRLRDWHEAGVWDRLHELLLAKLRPADQIDFSRAAVDSSSVRAVGAGKKLARTPLCATRLQAPHRHRRQRHTSRRDPDWRERQRCYAVAAADRRDSIDSRPARPPDSTVIKLLAVRGIETGSVATWVPIKVPCLASSSLRCWSAEGG